MVDVAPSIAPTVYDRRSQPILERAAL
jgi:hypothetical protein